MEGAPPPPRPALSPNTDPVATLVQKKKKKKHKNNETKKKTQKTKRSLRGWMEKENGAPHFPRAGRINTFMEGRQWQNPALILHSEQ